MAVLMNTKTGQQLPAHDDGTEYRFLGRIQTDRPKLQVRLFRMANPVIDPKTIPDFDWSPPELTILDQDGNGSCVGHGGCMFVQVGRAAAGMPYIPLSADSLYAQINGDRDQGADPGDAVTQLAANGICTLADVPDTFVLWRNIPALAKETAKRFRILKPAVYQLETFAEIATAIYLRFSVFLTVNVGGSFTPTADTGMVNFTPGFANHCVFGGCRKFTLPSGEPALECWNSWNTTWGRQGKFSINAQHIDKQPGGSHWALKWMEPDPLDPDNPPT